MQVCNNTTDSANTCLFLTRAFPMHYETKPCIACIVGCNNYTLEHGEMSHSIIMAV